MAVCAGKGRAFAPSWSKPQGKMICKRKSEITMQEAAETFRRMNEKLVTSNSTSRYQTQDHPGRDGPGNPDIYKAAKMVNTNTQLVLQKMQEEGVNLKEHPPMAPLHQRNEMNGQGDIPSHPLADAMGNFREEVLKISRMPGNRQTIEPPYVPGYINVEKQNEGQDQDLSTQDYAGPSGGKWLSIILLLLGGVTVLYFLI